MHPRRAAALAVTLLTLLVASRASAWQEAHQTGGDVDIRVDPSGGASIREVLRWHVVRGPIHWIDLANVDPTAAVEPIVTVAGDDGRPLSARATRRDANGVRIDVDDPHAFMRGNFTFELRWHVDGLKTGLIARDGTSWRLSWSSPLAVDGFESARTTFDLPPAREAPVAVFADTGAPDPGALSALRREATGDVLELVRPHVARGESVAWTLRIDPGAFAAVSDPHVRPVAEAPPPPEPDRVRAVAIAAALAALALSFGWLVAHKARAFSAACEARGTRSRAFLPLPDGARAVVSGLALAAGVGLQAFDAITPGSALIAAAILAAALRPPVARQNARGPGRWLALRPDEAFAGATSGGHWLDASTTTGRRVAGLASLLVLGLALLSRRVDAHLAWIVALDATALVPLFVTGRARDLPPEGTSAAASWLAPVFAQLRAVASLRVAPWARVVTGASTADELRLLVLPRVVMPGVVGVEIGRAWTTTPVGWAASPEVLVRVLDGSSAAAKLAQVLPRVRALPGRRADERVLRLRPRAGTRASTIALTRGLAEALTDRRAGCGANADPTWDGPIERRTPPRVPVRPPAAAAMTTSKAC